MKKLHKRIAELAMIRAIPLTADNVHQGRIKGLLVKLAVRSQKELNALPEIPGCEYQMIIDRVSDWGEMTWGHKKVHAVSMVSFALGMIENSDFKYPAKLIKTLSDITDYYDRDGKAPGICFNSGSVAADKWAMVMK